MNGQTILRVDGVFKSFLDNHVLRGIDLEMARGQVVGLLGSNGAGKTTAFNVVTGLLEADSGNVWIDGSSEHRHRQASIGVAPQEIALYPRLTCNENAAFFGGLFGLHGRSLRKRVDEVIELVGLTRYRDARVSTLSGGTRRRLNLAVAMVHNARLLILDEPTAGLDIEARFALWDTIRTLRNSGSSVLLTTHLLEEAAALCDRIALLHEGRIAREGTLQELCSTVPARQIAEAESDDEEALRNRATELGLQVRAQGARLHLRLPEQTSLEWLVARLHGTSIRSITLRPVGLEDVFFDVTT